MYTKQQRKIINSWWWDRPYASAVVINWQFPTTFVDFSLTIDFSKIWGKE